MIDTHCHIDLYKSPLDVIREAEASHTHTIAVTYLPSHFQMAKVHLRGHKYTRPALGLHPQATKDHEREIPLFKALCAEEDFIGEIGLDFSAGCKASRSEQELSFETALDCIKDRPRFISLHSRGAEDCVLGHLKRVGVTNAVFHWFSGSKSQLMRVVDAGHLLSINTSMICTAKWKEFIQLVPHDAILTESDGPFAKLGSRPGLPTDMSIIIQWLANSWKQPPKDVEGMIVRNCHRVEPLKGFIT